MKYTLIALTLMVSSSTFADQYSEKAREEGFEKFMNSQGQTEKSSSSSSSMPFMNGNNNNMSMPFMDGNNNNMSMPFMNGKNNNMSMPFFGDNGNKSFPFFKK